VVYRRPRSLDAPHDHGWADLFDDLIVVDDESVESVVRVEVRTYPS
jgi:hypothetical protein